MTQENKELLLKDLCARLPYGIKFPMMCWDEETGETVRPVTLYYINKDGYCHVSEDDYSPYIDEIKPYLFPLSSMTDEQFEKFIIISGWDGDIEDIRRGKFSCMGYVGLDYMYDAIDWLNKNHFDYRGLIPKGLAIDATGLNIY
jgi:hypothetical protein